MLSTRIRLFLVPLQSNSIRCASNLANVVQNRLKPELDSIREAGTWKSERIISTSQSAHIKIEHSSNQLLNFCANNYLGLANNPEIMKASKQAIDEYGAGLSSVRFICGTQTIHKQRKLNTKFSSQSFVLLSFSRTTNCQVSSTRRRDTLYLMFRCKCRNFRNFTQRTGLHN